MKLQLLIAKLNASIEDQSDQVCQNVPRILREAEALQQVRFSMTIFVGLFQYF